MNSYFISFGTHQGNLGVVIVQANNPATALRDATMRGLNPGGEAAIFPIEKQEAEKLGYNRIIPRSELEHEGYRSSFDMHRSERVNFLNKATVVCRNCNETIRGH